MSVLLDKQTLYVDEVSASVVRRIFQLACDGMGATAIADTLSEDKILIPSAYARQNHPEDCQCTNYHDSYTWNATTVGYILDRREYLVMLSRLVDTFFSRTSWTMLLYAENHSISVA